MDIMKSFDEIYGALEDLDEKLEELGYQGFEATMVGGGATLYHANGRGMKVGRKSTDDVDLVTDDIEAVCDLAKKYGSGTLGASGERIPLSRGKYADITWNHPYRDEIERQKEEGNMHRVEGFDNMEVYVMPPEAIIDEKSNLHREKDKKDVELMEEILP